MTKTLFYVYFIYTVLTANIISTKDNDDNSVLKQYYLRTYQGDQPAFDFPKPCCDLLETFAQYASNFTLCSIVNARPIRVCEKCVDHYVKFRDKYQELMQTVVNGTSCQSIFISHDRLDAVLMNYNNINDIWNKGNCKDCFDWSEKIPKLSNTTKRFNNMYNNTMDCILTNINPTLNNTERVCEKCMDKYVDLDEYYKSLSKDSIGLDVICMDIVDSMNTTRSIWSKSLNCCKLRKTPEVVFLVCSAVISVMPLLYYLALRFCGTMRDFPNVLKQSRFKQSILRTINERED